MFLEKETDTNLEIPVSFPAIVLFHEFVTTNELVSLSTISLYVKEKKKNATSLSEYDRINANGRSVVRPGMCCVELDAIQAPMQPEPEDVPSLPSSRNDDSVLMSRRVGQVVRVFARKFRRARLCGGAQNVLQTSVPTSAAVLPTAVVVALLGAEQLLQTDDEGQDQGDFADYESLACQEEQYPESDGYHCGHLHRHAHHHHAHHLLHLAAPLLHPSFQLAGAGTRQSDLHVETVQQRGNPVEQDLVEYLVLARRGSAQLGLQLGERAPRQLLGIRAPDQLEILRKGQIAYPAQPLEERYRLLLETRRHGYVPLLAILVHPVHRPEPPVDQALLLLVNLRTYPLAERAPRQQDGHTLE